MPSVASRCSAAAAGRLHVEVKTGWREPCNLYALVVLPPAERKSAVFSHVAGPFLGLESELTEEAQPAIREAARLGVELDEIQVPAVPRLVADDATPEALASLLAEQDGRMAVLSPEGLFFENLAGRYDRRGAANLSCVLKAHAGDKILVDRKGRPAEEVDNPALTLGLAVQPEVIRKIAAQPGFRGQGFLARLLCSLPVPPWGTASGSPGCRRSSPRSTGRPS